MPGTTTVLLEVPSATTTPGEADAAEELQRELARIADAEVSRRPVRRAIDVAAIGQLVVTLSGVAGGLGTVVETVRGWLAQRGSTRTVKLQIGDDVLELSGVDSEEQRRLVDEWLARHPAPG